MRPARIIATVLFVAALAVTGCTAHPSTDHPAAAPLATHPNPTPQPPPHPTDPTPVDRQAPIYTAVLRQYLSSGHGHHGGDAGFGEHRLQHIFVLDRAVAGTGAPGWTAPGGGPIPAAVQRAVAHALADVGPLTFVAAADAVIVDRNRCARVRDEGILVTLGPVDGAGDRVQVGVNGFVACLGTNSLTYVVQRTSRGWVVGGIAARGPVA